MSSPISALDFSRRLPHPVTTWTRQLRARPRSPFVDGVQRAALATTLIALVRALVSPAPFDYAESDTATWVWMLRHGEPIYGHLSTLPMRLTHYPPLHLWLVAQLAALGGILFAARLMSLVGLVMTALAAQLCVARATDSPRVGWTAALLVTTTAQLVYFGASARGDLFALGLGALAMTTVALRTRAWPLTAALLFALALMCKHNLVVLPLSALAWALWRQPGRALVFGLGLTTLVGGSVWRWQLWAPLVAQTHTGWRLSCFLSLAATDVLPSVAAVVVVTLGVRQSRRLPAFAAAVLEPWLVACAVGALWLLALGRVGSSSNYVLEWLLALSVVATIVAHFGIGARLMQVHVTAAAVLTLVKLVPLVLVILPRCERELDLARALPPTSGPVLAERTWLATVAGEPPVVMPFFAHQLALRHLWNEAPLVDLARHQQLTRVLVDFALDDPALAQRHSDRFAPELLALLRRNYVQTATVGQLHVYLPRERARTLDANKVASSR